MDTQATRVGPTLSSDRPSLLIYIVNDGVLLMTSVVESHHNKMPRLNLDEADSTPALGLFEPFVNEHVIARFLEVTPRRVLEMARKGDIPAHPIGHVRKTWRFRMS